MGISYKHFFYFWNNGNQNLKKYIILFIKVNGYSHNDKGSLISRCGQILKNEINGNVDNNMI